MITTPRYPYSKDRLISSIDLMRTTVEVWDQLKSEGFRPADCGKGMITMRPVEFKRAFAGHRAADYINRGLRTLSVWVGPVEISCVVEEERDNTGFTTVSAP